MVEISVIMAAYNSETYIKESIDSILKQSFSNWELLICDDCSTDNTYNIIENYALKDTRIKIIRNNSNSKAAFSRNRCLEIAQGEYIAIQDADDISNVHRFTKQFSFLKNHKNIDFVGSDSASFNENGTWRISKSKSFPEKKDFLKGIPFTHASILFKKDSLKLVNGYRVSKETVRGQDSDMIMRMYALNLKGANISEILYHYREDMNALKRRTLKIRLDVAKVSILRFRDLDLMPVGYLFAIKPVLIGLIPKKIYFIIKKIISRRTK